MKAETAIGSKRRRELIEIMAQVVGEVGISGATLRKVAERTGSSMGLLTYHYKTKRDLVIDALVCAAEEFSARVQSMTSRPGRSRFETLFDQLSQSDRPTLLPMSFWLSYWDEATRDPGLKQYYSEHNEKTRESFKAHVEAAIENGEFAPDVDPSLAADLLLTYWHGLRVERTLAHEHVSDERAMQASLLLLDLLRPQPEQRTHTRAEEAG